MLEHLHLDDLRKKRESKLTQEETLELARLRKHFTNPKKEGMDEHEARDFLPNYIRRLKKTKIKELRTFSRTLENWFDEIIHSFRCVKREKGKIFRPHYSNAIIEGMNIKIMIIKRVS